MKIPILTFVTEYQSSVCYLSYDTHHSCLISTEPDAGFLHLCGQLWEFPKIPSTEYLWRVCHYVQKIKTKIQIPMSRFVSKDMRKPALLCRHRSLWFHRNEKSCFTRKMIVFLTFMVFYHKRKMYVLFRNMTVWILYCLYKRSKILLNVT